MKGILTAAIAAGALWATVPRADATLLQYCCACVAGERAQTSGAFGANPQVFFCAEAQANDIPGLEDRCDAFSDQQGNLHCEANIPGPTCRAQLADAAIFCPAAGAPAASPAYLIVLIAALAALGTAAVRRRRQLQRIMEDWP